MAERGAVGAGVSGFAETLAPFLRLWGEDFDRQRTQQVRTQAEQGKTQAEADERSRFAPIYTQLVTLAASDNANPLQIAQLAAQLGQSSLKFYQDASVDFRDLASKMQREGGGIGTLDELLRGKVKDRPRVGTLNAIPPVVPEPRMPGMGTKITPPAPTMRKAPTPRTPLSKPPVAPTIERPMTGQIVRDVTGPESQYYRGPADPNKPVFRKPSDNLSRSILDLSPEELARAARMPEFANVVRTEELRRQVDRDRAEGAGGESVDPDQFIIEAQPYINQILSGDPTMSARGQVGLTTLFRNKLGITPNFTALTRGLDRFDPNQIVAAVIESQKNRISQIAGADPELAQQELAKVALIATSLVDEIENARNERVEIARMVQSGQTTSEQARTALQNWNARAEQDRQLGYREHPEIYWLRGRNKAQRLLEALQAAGR